MAINKVIKKKKQNSPHGSYQSINPLKAWVNEFQLITSIKRVFKQPMFFSPLTQVNKPPLHESIWQEQNSTQAPCIGLYKPCTTSYLFGTFSHVIYYPQVHNQPHIATK